MHLLLFHFLVSGAGSFLCAHLFFINGALQHDHAADHLDHIGTQRLTQRLRQLLGRLGGRLQVHPHLDQLPHIQCVVQLGDQVVRDPLFADLEDGLQSVGLGTPRGPFFTCHIRFSNSAARVRSARPLWLILSFSSAV